MTREEAIKKLNKPFSDLRGNSMVGYLLDSYKEDVKELINKIYDDFEKGEAEKGVEMCLRDKTKVCDLCHECDVDPTSYGYQLNERSL